MSSEKLDIIDTILKLQNTMEHFYEKIYGWFDFDDIYSEMVAINSSNSHFVEIGSFFGKSTAFMAVEIFNSHKKIKFDVVDTFEGSPEHKNLIEGKKVLDIFLENIEPVKNIINKIQIGYSEEKAKLYKDESLDFVFIDANHTYEYVKKDIEAWLPKIKKGGIIGGHDFNIFYWPGVVQAVTEKFNYYIVKRNSWMVDVN